MFYINNVAWKLAFVSRGSDLLKRSDGSQTVGMTDNLTQMIYIDETLRGPFLRKVLCHELTHAAIFSYGIELNVDEEEIIADLVATYGQKILDMTNEIFGKLRNRTKNQGKGI